MNEYSRRPTEKKYFDNTTLFTIIGGGAILSILLAIAFLAYLAVMWGASFKVEEEIPDAVAAEQTKQLQQTESQIKLSAKLKSIKAPVYDDKYITSWLANAVQKSLTYNHLSRIEHHTSSLRDLYTIAGINRLHLLVETDLTERRESGEASSALARLVDTPQIIIKEIVKGRYQWDVNIPIERIFVLADGFILKESNSVTISLVRSLETENPYAIAINNIEFME